MGRKREPSVLCATVREAWDPLGDIPELHIECRMSDGQKGAFIVVDDGFPLLAQKIADFLNSGGIEG